MPKHIARKFAIRILHVVPTYLPAKRYGGPIRSVHGLCKGLVDRGHSVTVVTTNVDGPYDCDVPLEQAVTLDGVTVWYCRSRWLRRLYWSPALKRILRQHISRSDIVHLHSVFLWPTFVAARLARRSRVPYIISPRGMLVADLIRRKSNLAKRFWIELVERRSLSHAAAVHVTSEVERTEIEKLDLDLAPLVQVANGVAPPAEAEARSTAGSRLPAGPYLLFLSRINWKKGLDRLMAALARVPDVTVVIAGNDEEGYGSEVKKMARDFGVADRVTFFGPVSDGDKWALYASAEMFVLPSYSESFGMVVLEAMAMGCPVVVTPEVGLADIIAREHCGLVVDGNPEPLGDAIARLLANPGLRRAMAGKAREVARTQFSWEAIALQMERAYQQVLDSRSAGRP